jgi:hypothetical protein
MAADGIRVLPTWVDAADPGADLTVGVPRENKAPPRAGQNGAVELALNDGFVLVALLDDVSHQGVQ